MSFGLSSIIMMVGNKVAFMAFPLTYVLIALQDVGTLIALGLFHRHEVTAFERSKMLLWLPCVLLFFTMLTTSLLALGNLTVSTFVIFRNVGALVNVFAEHFILHKPISVRLVASLAGILGGAIMYAAGDVMWTRTGLLWCIANVIAQCSYSIVVRLRMERCPPLKEMQPPGMSLYNNAMALPLFLCGAGAAGEWGRLRGVVDAMDARGCFGVALTIVAGYLLSVHGFRLQKLVSATDFLVVNNLTKVVSIILGVIFLGDAFRGFGAMVGCAFSLGCGAWYSYEQMLLNAPAPPPLPLPGAQEGAVGTRGEEGPVRR